MTPGLARAAVDEKAASGGNHVGGRTPTVGNPNHGMQPGGNHTGGSAIDLFNRAKKLLDR